MCETKLTYVIKFGVAQHVCRKLIKDVADAPFSFLFDETANNRLKKQYDGYVVYWSKQDRRVVNRYCGSLFVGHCDADALVNHYLDFVKHFSVHFRIFLPARRAKQVSLIWMTFFQTCIFFFKRSSARRDDYASLANITGVTAEYLKEHAETRWVSMKYQALRCLEQWENLKEYFLKFLPQQKNFKKEVEKTRRYESKLL